jgi:hypothetical protein
MPPDFLCIGAHKAGTTWLHQMLGLHPDIGLPVNKELHFWDKSWPAGKPISSYEQVFSAIDRPIKGEITPAYAILPQNTIEVIHNHYPSLKIIYILRNPLERAWSHARMGFSRTFSDFAGNPIELQGEWFLEHFESTGSLRRGSYAACIANWTGCYPQEQLALLLYDDIVADPAAFLETCCAHLHAHPGVYDNIESASLSRNVYPETIIWKSKESALPAEVPAIFVPALLDIYRPKVEELSRLLGRDFSSLWLTRYAR